MKNHSVGKTKPVNSRSHKKPTGSVIKPQLKTPDTFLKRFNPRGNILLKMPSRNTPQKTADGNVESLDVARPSGTESSDVEISEEENSSLKAGYVKPPQSFSKIRSALVKEIEDIKKDIDVPKDFVSLGISNRKRHIKEAKLEGLDAGRRMILLEIKEFVDSWYNVGVEMPNNPQFSLMVTNGGYIKKFELADKLKKMLGEMDVGK